MDLFEKIENTLLVADNYLLQDRKDHRMSFCGKAVFIHEKENGGRKISTWYCKDPRCDICSERKGNFYRERIRSVIESGLPVMMVYLNKDIADKFCKKIGKENYIRFPGMVDTIFFVSNDDGDHMTNDDLDEIDFAELSRKNGDRILSGRLGSLHDDEIKKKIMQDGMYSFDTTDLVIVTDAKKAYDLICSVSYGVIAWQSPYDKDENQRYRDVFNSQLIGRIALEKIQILAMIKSHVHCDNLDINFFDIENQDAS